MPVLERGVDDVVHAMLRVNQGRPVFIPAMDKAPRTKSWTENDGPSDCSRLHAWFLSSWCQPKQIAGLDVATELEKLNECFVLLSTATLTVEHLSPINGQSQLPV